MPGHFTALSVRYTGYEVSDELAYFAGLASATNVAEAVAAQDNFRVGSQNFIVADSTSINWSTESATGLSIIDVATGTSARMLRGPAKKRRRSY